MKTKILLLLSLIVLALNSYSQNLTFKGIPINGTISQFVDKLKQQGITYKNMSESGTTAYCFGEFAGYKNCEINVVGSPSLLVWKVVVYLPEQSSWSIIKGQYFLIKDAFNSKLGKGDTYEDFISPYFLGDGYEMQAVRLEKCDYSTFWQTSEGYIKVEISRFLQLRVSFEDTKNSDIDSAEKQQLINSNL